MPEAWRAVEAETRGENNMAIDYLRHGLNRNTEYTTGLFQILTLAEKQNNHLLQSEFLARLERDFYVQSTPTLKANLELAKARMALKERRYQEAIEKAEGALDRYRALHRPASEAAAILLHGRALSEANDPKADETLELAYQAGLKADDFKLTEEATHALATFAAKSFILPGTNKIQKAREMPKVEAVMQRLIKLYHQNGLYEREGYFWWRLGVYYNDEGDFTNTQRCWTEGLKLLCYVHATDALVLAEQLRKLENEHHVLPLQVRPEISNN